MLTGVTDLSKLGLCGNIALDLERLWGLSKDRVAPSAGHPVGWPSSLGDTWLMVGFPSLNASRYRWKARLSSKAVRSLPV